MSEPNTKVEYKIYDELKQAVFEFYECDEFTLMRPRKKEFVQVNINVNKGNIYTKEVVTVLFERTKLRVFKMDIISR